MTVNDTPAPGRPWADAPSAAELQTTILNCLQGSVGKDPARASLQDWRIALSLAIRGCVIERWLSSRQRTRAEQRKRVCYLSMEFLPGRFLEDAMRSLGVQDEARRAIECLGIDYAGVVALEPDPALGNGGLGRLAACFLDSLSTLEIPALGYGIRFEHGYFRQRFQGGEQREEPEDWLLHGYLWEFPRPEASTVIGFEGSVDIVDGRAVWRPGQSVVAVPHDTPIIGWRGRWANTLRLWSARPTRVFELDPFLQGAFQAAAAPEIEARSLTRVLYPDDATAEGRELRLRQEYFLAAASMQDLVRRLLAEEGDLGSMPERVAIQLNDTHPAIAIPELIRLLHDEHGTALEKSIRIARSCLAYTNHTLMPEALERWPEALLARLLPRHHQIIGELDDRHAIDTAGRGGPPIRIIHEGEVRMGALAFIGSRRVNGVSAIHTRLVRETVFRDLSRIHPDRVVNQTNGVSLRRWLHGCNPALARLITEAVGEDWPADPGAFDALSPCLSESRFLSAFAEAKRTNKLRLSRWLADNHGLHVDPDAMFDAHIKRFHEYKRQLLNLLETIARWNALRDTPGGDRPPRVKIFAGKAAPGYRTARQVIRLIHDAAAVINAEPSTRDLLQIVFPADYNVSMAERIIPASDLSEQISTAGTEASGTGNMKFALNGAVTIGTLDGANIEIRDRVGAENFIRFGLSADEVGTRRAVPAFARRAIAESPELARVLDQIATGRFSPEERNRYADLVRSLVEEDHFLVSCDFESYSRAQRKADEAFRHSEGWVRMAAANTVRCGWFSSDRAVLGYARDIWNIDRRYSRPASPEDRRENQA